MSGSLDDTYNIGSDTELTIISNGVVLAAAILTTFEARQRATELTSKAIDGINRFRYVEEGWDITLGWDRADSTIDDYFAAKEEGRYQGLRPPIVYIVETTTDANTGLPAKYRYEGVSLRLDTIGSRSGDGKVDPRVTGSASRRIKVI